MCVAVGIRSQFMNIFLVSSVNLRGTQFMKHAPKNSFYAHSDPVQPYLSDEKSCES